MSSECGRSLACLRSDLHVYGEQTSQKLIIRRLNQLHEIAAEGVAIFLEKTVYVVLDIAREMNEAKRVSGTRFWSNVVFVCTVKFVQLFQATQIGSLF